MDRTREATARIHEIEAQQDEILRQLEALERRTELVLAQHAPPAPAAGAAGLMIDPAGACAPDAD